MLPVAGGAKTPLAVEKRSEKLLSCRLKPSLSLQFLWFCRVHWVWADPAYSPDFLFVTEKEEERPRIEPDFEPKR